MFADLGFDFQTDVCGSFSGIYLKWISLWHTYSTTALWSNIDLARPPSYQFYQLVIKWFERHSRHETEHM
ncbi:hypothetical protein Pcinc_040145 [Petrolisthes cinctipes]|uniref:Uncharacterized protein n=1 Tax=Petrolisthes cinctipes TaxID=88211 RepID=A0AAE1BMH4_PETCI|nr:hypothetical protein Pcinc_040145 [Petrolisthes cinctipes]